MLIMNRARAACLRSALGRPTTISLSGASFATSSGGTLTFTASVGNGTAQKPTGSVVFGIPGVSNIEYALTAGVAVVTFSGATLPATYHCNVHYLGDGVNWASELYPINIAVS